MRHVYLVSYDIANPKRLRRTFKTLKQFGIHTQYSVFVCKLSDNKKRKLTDILINIICPEEDQVLFFPLGPESKYIPGRILSIGKPYHVHIRKPIII